MAARTERRSIAVASKARQSELLIKHLTSVSGATGRHRTRPPPSCETSTCGAARSASPPQQLRSSRAMRWPRGAHARAWSSTFIHPINRSAVSQEGRDDEKNKRVAAPCAGSTPLTWRRRTPQPRTPYRRLCAAFQTAGYTQPCALPPHPPLRAAAAAATPARHTAAAPRASARLCRPARRRRCERRSEARLRRRRQRTPARRPSARRRRRARRSPCPSPERPGLHIVRRQRETLVALKEERSQANLRCRRPRERRVSAGRRGVAAWSTVPTRASAEVPRQTAQPLTAPTPELSASLTGQRKQVQRKENRGANKNVSRPAHLKVRSCLCSYVQREACDTHSDCAQFSEKKCKCQYAHLATDFLVLLVSSTCYRLFESSPRAGVTSFALMSFMHRTVSSSSMASREVKPPKVMPTRAEDYELCEEIGQGVSAKARLRPRASLSLAGRPCRAARRGGAARPRRGRSDAARLRRSCPALLSRAPSLLPRLTPPLRSIARYASPPTRWWPSKCWTWSGKTRASWCVGVAWARFRRAALQRRLRLLAAAALPTAARAPLSFVNRVARLCETHDVTLRPLIPSRRRRFGRKPPR